LIAANAVAEVETTAARPSAGDHHPKEDADVDPESCHHGRTAPVHEGVSRDQGHIHAGCDDDDCCNGEKRAELHRPMIATPSRASNKTRSFRG